MSYQVTYRDNLGNKNAYFVSFASNVTEAIAETMANIEELKLHPNRITSVVYQENQ